MLKIEARLDDRGIAELKRVAAAIDRAAREIPKLGAAEIIDALRLETSRFARSGRLSRSFRVATTERAAEVTTTVPYARIQDQGGVIRARSGFLAIPTLRGPGKLRMVRSVRIPAKHWLDRAARRAESEVADAAFDRVSEAVSRG